MEHLITFLKELLARSGGNNDEAVARLRANNMLRIFWVSFTLAVFAFLSRMRIVPLTDECLQFLLGVESVLARVAAFNSLLASLTLVAVVRVQYLVAHALLLIFEVGAELPALLTLQTLAILVEVRNLRITPQARRLRLTFLLFAVDAIDQFFTATLALNWLNSPVEVETMSAFNADV